MDQDTVVRIVCGILAVIILIVLIYRLKNKKAK